MRWAFCILCPGKRSRHSYEAGIGCLVFAFLFCTVLTQLSMRSFLQPRAKNVEDLTYAELDLNSEENHNDPNTPWGAQQGDTSPWETRNSNGYEYAPIRHQWLTDSNRDHIKVKQRQMRKHLPRQTTQQMQLFIFLGKTFVFCVVIKLLLIGSTNCFSGCCNGCFRKQVKVLWLR